MHLVELWRKSFRLSPASNRIIGKTKFWARKRIFCSNPPKNESEEFREQVFTRLSFDYGFEFALRYFHSSDCWRVRIFLWAFLKIQDSVFCYHFSDHLKHEKYGCVCTLIMWDCRKGKKYVTSLQLFEIGDVLVSLKTCL